MSKQRVQKSAKKPAEVKGVEAGKIQPVFHRVSEEEISTALTILTNVVGKREPVLTQQQICSLTTRGTSTVSNWVKEGALPAVWFVLIAQEAARRGDFALVNLLIPRNYALTPIEAGAINGDCSDEECAIVGAADRARLAYEARDPRTFSQSIDELKRELASLEAEGRALL